MKRKNESRTEQEVQIALFSMEIGIDYKMLTYSGGLGVLAGDILRSCADLRVPIVAVMLASNKGYLYQRLDDECNQTELPIGSRTIEGYTDQSDDSKDAEDLYDKLEQVIVPMLYNNKDAWTEIMRYAIAFNSSFFNSHRMVSQYLLNAYFT